MVLSVGGRRWSFQRRIPPSRLEEQSGEHLSSDFPSCLSAGLDLVSAGLVLLLSGPDLPLAGLVLLLAALVLLLSGPDLPLSGLVLPLFGPDLPLSGLVLPLSEACWTSVGQGSL